MVAGKMKLIKWRSVKIHDSGTARIIKYGFHNSGTSRTIDKCWFQMNPGPRKSQIHSESKKRPMGQ